jgi:hypothetical protein
MTRLSQQFLGGRGGLNVKYVTNISDSPCFQRRKSKDRGRRRTGRGCKRAYLLRHLWRSGELLTNTF